MVFKQDKEERLQAVTQRFGAAIAAAERQQGRIKYQCHEGGVISVDWANDPTRVSNEDGEADCTVELSLDTLEAMTNGNLAPSAAFARGKLRLIGDLSIAMRMTAILQNMRS